MKFTPSPQFRDAPPYRLGVLLVNSGTPDSLDSQGVRRFLRRLLRDRRTIEVSRAIWCWVLYFIILPLRPSRVLPKYRRVWTAAGSPLLVHSQSLRAKLAAALQATCGTEVPVELGMLYSTPDVAQGLAALRAAGAQRIAVLPLFPQYSGTTNAAAMDQVGRAFKLWRYLPELRFLPDYATHAAYIEALAQSVRGFRSAQGAGEHLLITFHGIPKQYVADGDPYERKCEATARARASALGLNETQWSLSFQSRVGRAEWLKPYTETVIAALAERRISTLDAICPGFAVDCLETLDEVAHEYGEQFRLAGGGQLRYIPALNDSSDQVQLLQQLLLQTD